jgi:hypothetical protein
MASKKAILGQYQYASCRDLRHSWVHITWTVNFDVIRKGRKYKEIVRVLSCSKCQTHRVDTYETRTFTRVARHYAYPERYLIPGGGFKPSDFVTAAVREAFAKQGGK